MCTCVCVSVFVFVLVYMSAGICVFRFSDAGTICQILATCFCLVWFSQPSVND